MRAEESFHRCMCVYVLFHWPKTEQACIYSMYTRPTRPASKAKDEAFRQWKYKSKQIVSRYFVGFVKYVYVII